VELQHRFLVRSPPPLPTGRSAYNLSAEAFVEGDERLAKITARIVLSHRTGLPNWPADDGSVSIYFTPGERFSYSGEGYIYLQRVVEKITGKPLNEYMTEAVFTPLGMTSSSYVWRPDFDALTATGHDSHGKPTELEKPAEALAASTLNTTANDYALFVEAVLNGKGSSQRLCARWKRRKSHSIRSAGFASSTSRSSYRRICFGDWDGASSATMEPMCFGIGETTVHSRVFVIADPKTKSGVVMFANSENGLKVGKPLVDEVMGRGSLAFEWLK